MWKYDKVEEKKTLIIHPYSVCFAHLAGSYLNIKPAENESILLQILNWTQKILNFKILHKQGSTFGTKYKKKFKYAAQPILHSDEDHELLQMLVQQARLLLEDDSLI